MSHSAMRHKFAELIDLDAAVERLACGKLRKMIRFPIEPCVSSGNVG